MSQGFPAIPIRTRFVSLDDVSPAGPPGDGRIPAWSEDLGHVVWVDPGAGGGPYDPANVAITGGTISGVNLTVGTGAIAVSATDWGLQLPTMPGPPTGVPAVTPGLAPVTVDSTSGRLWTHAGGQSRGLALASEVASRTLLEAAADLSRAIAWDRGIGTGVPGTADSGHPWTVRSGSWARVGSGLWGDGLVTIDAGTPNHEIAVQQSQEIAGGAVWQGVAALVAGATNYAALQYRKSSNDARLIVVVGGVTTVLASKALTIATSTHYMPLRLSAYVRTSTGVIYLIGWPPDGSSALAAEVSDPSAYAAIGGATSCGLVSDLSRPDYRVQAIVVRRSKVY